jgi:hypothetical protein
MCRRRVTCSRVRKIFHNNVTGWASDESQRASKEVAVATGTEENHKELEPGCPVCRLAQHRETDNVQNRDGYRSNLAIPVILNLCFLAAERSRALESPPC